MSDKVYVLSASYSGERLMYAAYNRLGATLRINKANIWSTREEAENELSITEGNWQITLISKKKLFKMKLSDK